MDVRMPDGTVIRNVPEGVTKSQLQARLAKLPTNAMEDAQQQLAPKESPGFIDRIKQGAADANIGFNQRATDLQLAAKDNLPEWASNALTYEIGKGVPTRDELVRRQDVLKGASQDLAAQKQGDEGILASIQRGLGNPVAVASMLSGGPLYASAFGGGAGAEFLASSPEGKSLGQKASDAGVAGGISAVAAPVFGKVIDSAARPAQAAKNVGGLAGKLLGFDPARMATFAEAGVVPTLGDVSKSGVVKRTQNLLDDVPLASNTLDKGKERVAEGVKRGLAQAGFDDSLERAVGGDAARQGLKTYVDRGRALFTKAFDDFDAKHIAPDEMTSATNTFAKINDIIGRADTAEALDAYLGPTEKAIIGKIKAAAGDAPTATNASSTAASRVQDYDANLIPKTATKSAGYDPFMTPVSETTAVMKPAAPATSGGSSAIKYDAYLNPIKAKPELTYNDFKLFRTAIGKKLDDYTIGSSDKSVLRELYGAMTSDLRQKASEKGASTLKAFDRLNNNYRQFSEKLDNTVSEVINKGEASQVFNAVKQGLPLPERTGVVMRSLPADKRDIVRGALIREMGTARTQAGGGQFDPVRFAAEFRKLDPKAQDAMLIGMPAQAKASFQKLVDAALLAKQTALQGNPSGSARNWLIAAGAAGGVSNPVLTAKIIGTGALTARLMTSPKFLTWLANTQKGTGTAPGRHIGMLSGIVAGDNAASEDAAELQRALTSGEQQPPSDEAAPVTLTPMESSQPAPLIDKFAQAESGGNPNARNPMGTASGLLQFTDDTWARSVAKWGKEFGITLKDKMNPEAQRLMGRKLAEDNARILRKQTGREPTDGELYAAHFLGAPDAAKLLKAQGSGKQAIMLFSRRVVNDNRPVFFDGKRPRTVEEVMQVLNSKVMA